MLNALSFFSDSIEFFFLVSLLLKSVHLPALFIFYQISYFLVTFMKLSQLSLNCTL